MPIADSVPLGMLRRGLPVEGWMDLFVRWLAARVT